MNLAQSPLITAAAFIHSFIFAFQNAYTARDIKKSSVQKQSDTIYVQSKHEFIWQQGKSQRNNTKLLNKYNDNAS